MLLSNFELLILFSRFSRARPIIIDPGLYHMKKSGVFWAKEKRSMPASFKVFMGTARDLLPFPDSPIYTCIFVFYVLVIHLPFYFTDRA